MLLKIKKRNIKYMYIWEYEVIYLQPYSLSMFRIIYLKFVP